MTKIKDSKVLTMAERLPQPDGSVPEAVAGQSLPAERIPGWVSVVVVLGAALTAAGAIISKLNPAILANGVAMTAAARVYADYLFARDLPLAVMLCFLLVLRARRMLAGFMVLTALIQIIDLLNDAARGDYVLVPGLLVFAITFLIGATQLFGQPFWHLAAWREPEIGSAGPHPTEDLE